MTNTTTAATVETLTAEVRTLVVGSRQVTLSVAKQLDTIPLDRLVVMGRVRIDKESTDRKGWVIGVDTATGSLALAKWNIDARIAKPVVWDDDGLSIVVCRPMRLNDYEAHLQIDKTPFTAFNPKRNPACDCARGGFCGWNVGGSTTLDEVAAYVEQQMVLTAAERDRCKAAADAPLIVLAGLK